jgi:hypothetical protein
MLQAKFTGGRLVRIIAKKVFFCLGPTFGFFFNWAGNPEKSKPAWQGTQRI